MRRTLLVLLCVVAASIVYAAPAYAAQTKPVVFLNINVVPMTSETILAAQTVVVDAGKVVAIGPATEVEVPEKARVIDGTDRFLMPGLTEMHAHVPGANSADLDRILTLFAARGVTTLRGMLGQPSHLELRKELASPGRFAPALITSGPSLNGNSVSGAAAGEAAVEAQHAAGYDFLKIHPGLTRAEFSAIADRANQLEMPFAGHVTADVGIVESVAAGMATVDHLDGYFAALMPVDSDPSGGFGGFLSVLLIDQLQPERLDEVVAATAATWNVPTQSLFEHRVSAASPEQLAAGPGMRYMPEATVQQWINVKRQQLGQQGFSLDLGERAIALRRDLIRAIQRDNGRLLMGSDAPQVFNVPGFAAHTELATYAAAGLTPFEALQSATIKPAQFLGTAGGRVAVGADADLVVVDANPLVDIGNAGRIHGVMLRGVWFDAAAIEARLAPLRRD